MARVLKAVFRGGETKNVANCEKERSEREKILADWKPPKLPIHHVYRKEGVLGFRSSNDAIKTLENTVPVPNEGATLQLLSPHAIRQYQRLGYEDLHLGLVQVGVKPLTASVSGGSVCVCLRDCRLLRFRDSLLGMVESSISDGPIYFNCFPNYQVSLSDPHICDVLTVDVTRRGLEMEDRRAVGMAVVYRAHLKVTPGWFLGGKVTESFGKTTLVQTNLLKDGVAVAKTIDWDSVEREWRRMMSEKSRKLARARACVFMMIGSLSVCFAIQTVSCSWVVLYLYGIPPFLIDYASEIDKSVGNCDQSKAWQV